MSEHDWEALGRDAVRLGMPAFPNAKNYYGGLTKRRPALFLGTDWFGDIPDLSDELTALATIPWVQSVAREVYGGGCLSVHFRRDGTVCVSWDDSGLGPCCVGPTLPHAALALVRAMRGEREGATE